MAVGNQLGYLATSRALSLPVQVGRALHCAMTGLPGCQGQQLLTSGHGARHPHRRMPPTLVLRRNLVQGLTCQLGAGGAQNQLWPALERLDLAV